MKTLIVYYSQSGNTALTARRMAEALQAELLEIAPETPYPDRGAARFLQGGKSALAGDTPPLQEYDFDPQRCGRVILGFPVWAGSVAPPLRTFVKENLQALKGLRLAAFCCQSGSGGAEKAGRVPGGRPPGPHPGAERPRPPSPRGKRRKARAVL